MAPYTGFSKGRCVSPGAMILDELEELEAAAAQAALPIPGPVALPQPVESTTVGFDMAALLQAVGGADLDTVTSLSLRLLVQDSSLQRLGLCLPSLTSLNLDGSYLVSLRDLGTGMSRLRVLRVTRCSLYSLDGLSCLAGLRELYAAHNGISDIWACAALPHLRVLDLSYTQVRMAGHAGFLSPCSRLHSLSLLGSPAASSGQSYRTEVQLQLPDLQLLDGRAFHPASSTDNQVSGSDSGDEESASADSATSEADVTAEILEFEVTPARPRPSSASVASTTSTESRELGARRVMSARPRANTGSFHAENTGDEEAPSGLTSGGVVCGSLAAALRRRPVTCWIQNSGMSTRQQGTSTSTEQPRSDQLLDTARQWRENYSRFRDQNGSRWEEEEAETKADDSQSGQHEEDDENPEM